MPAITGSLGRQAQNNGAQRSAHPLALLAWLRQEGARVTCLEIFISPWTCRRGGISLAGENESHIGKICWLGGRRRSSSRRSRLDVALSRILAIFFPPFFVLKVLKATYKHRGKRRAFLYPLEAKYARMRINEDHNFIAYSFSRTEFPLFAR